MMIPDRLPYGFYIASYLLLLCMISLISCETFEAVKGVFVDSNPMKIVHGVSVISCTQKCAFHKTCKGVNYNKKKLECKLFSNIGNTSKTTEWDLYLKDEKDKTKVNGCEERFYVSQPHYPFCSHCDVRWELIQRSVCFGAVNDDFAVVPINHTMYVCGLRYKYRSGYIDCGQLGNKIAGRYWICEKMSDVQLGYIVTDRSKNVIFPKRKTFNDGMWYVVNEEVKNSDILEFSSYLETITLENEIQFWFGEDLIGGNWRDNNSGTLCVDVYAGVM